MRSQRLTPIGALAKLALALLAGCGGPSVLAYDTEAYSLQMDATHVFFSGFRYDGENTSGVFRVAIDGGGLELLQSGGGELAGATGSHLLVCDPNESGGQWIALPKNGAAPILLFPGTTFEVAQVATQCTGFRVVRGKPRWVERDAAEGGATLYEVQEAGGPPVEVVTIDAAYLGHVWLGERTHWIDQTSSFNRRPRLMQADF